MRLWFWFGLALIAFGLAPALSVLISSGVAASAGCTLNEGGVTPCPFFSFDMGGLLANMFVFGWFMLITLPVAFAGGVLLLLLKTADLIKWLRAKR